MIRVAGGHAQEEGAGGVFVSGAPLRHPESEEGIDDRRVLGKDAEEPALSLSESVLAECNVPQAGTGSDMHGTALVRASECIAGQRDRSVPVERPPLSNVNVRPSRATDLGLGSVGDEE